MLGDLKYSESHDGQNSTRYKLSIDNGFVHLKPAVVEASVVHILEAQAEQHHNEGASPADASVLNNTKILLPRLGKSVSDIIKINLIWVDFIHEGFYNLRLKIST